jgi:hypothetical protein
VRGIALAQAAGRVGLEFATFGPTAAVEGWTGSEDWADRAAAWAPDLLIGDLTWRRLKELRERLGVPAWLLVRWLPPAFLAGITGWDRVVSIEPAADALPGVTHHAPPVLTDPVPPPEPGAVVSAGYNAYWQGQRGAWAVTWRDDGRPERAARIGTASERYDGADMILAWARGPVVYTFDPRLSGRDYRVDDHGFRARGLTP